MARYAILTNKYSYAGSGYTRRDSETDSLADAILRADIIRPYQRFAVVVDTTTDTTVYTALVGQGRR